MNAGNNLANAYDIYGGIHYANAKVAVIEIDKKKIGEVVVQEIPFITQYYSFKF